MKRKNYRTVTYVKNLAIVIIAGMILISSIGIAHAAAPLPTNPQSGSIGVSGTLPAPTPTESPTIVSPANGAVFTSLPVNVTGFCPGDLLVKLFDNNVFSGSAACKNNSYTIQTDLFSGTNQLVARSFNALDESGPDSNVVTVTYNDSANVLAPSARINLTSNYAIKGADPKQTLVWPIIVSGGVAPYAVSVDWGDGTPNDIYTVTSPGDFNVKHVYEQSGVYRVLVKAADKNNEVAYLQLTAICNGIIKKNGEVAGSTETIISVGWFSLLWKSIIITLPLMVVSFYLGDKYAVNRIKARLKKGEWLFKR